MTPRYETILIEQGYNLVAGCDEVGRGSLAGPVVAAAVVFDFSKTNAEQKKLFREINDSKLLTPSRREVVAPKIRELALGCGVGVVDPGIIDELNIHYATLLAMKGAVKDLLNKVSCEAQKVFLSVDGKFIIPEFNIKQEAVINGDSKVLSIAAASIVAKVYRDALMKKYHEQFPLYNFAQHKGYGTLHHREMIAKHGLSVIHRLSFCNQLI